MFSQDPAAISAFIKNKALEAGFAACGIAEAIYHGEEALRLATWLKKGYQGHMNYLEKYYDKRINPGLVLEGARSVICLLVNYQPEDHLVPRDNYRIARFALGRDYHNIIRKKLKELAEEVKTVAGDFNYRVFTDSAPVLERASAVKAGLGRIGKNACLIVPQRGSWFLLAEIICDLPLAYDQPPAATDPCGNCQICIDACPTGAIIAPRIIEARKCITYLNSVLKEEIPDSYVEQVNPWIRGCDVCQEVCPHNKSVIPATGNWFDPNPRLASMKKEEWNEMSPERFTELFKGSALEETGYDKMMMTIKQIRKKDEA